MKTIGSYKVLAFNVLDPSAARVQISVIGDRKSHIEAFDEEIRAKGLRVVESSDRLVEYNPNLQKSVITLMVARNQVTREASTTNKARMMAIASNMFVDADNSVWAEEGGMLVKNDNIETAEHLEKILTASSHLAKTVDSDARASYAALAGDSYHKPAVESGMYISYEHKGQIYDGFVVALSEDESQAIVQPRPDDAANPYPDHRISLSHVIDSFDLKELTTEVPKVPASEKMVVAAAGTTLTQALTYYRKMFSYNPAYFQKMAALIRGRGIYA